MKGNEDQRVLNIACQGMVKGIQNLADDAVFMFMGVIGLEMRYFPWGWISFFVGMGNIKVKGQGHTLKEQVKPD